MYTYYTENFKGVDLDYLLKVEDITDTEKEACAMRFGREAGYTMPLYGTIAAALSGNGVCLTLVATKPNMSAGVAAIMGAVPTNSELPKDLQLVWEGFAFLSKESVNNDSDGLIRAINSLIKSFLSDKPKGTRLSIWMPELHAENLRMIDNVSITVHSDKTKTYNGYKFVCCSIGEDNYDGYSSEIRDKPSDGDAGKEAEKETSSASSGSVESTDSVSATSIKDERP